MEEKFLVKDNCLFIFMPDEMDHNQADEMRMKADQIILEKRIQNLIFDFAGTKFMDSSGVGLIVGRYKKVKCFDGKVVAIHASPRIQKMLSISGLKDMIEIV